MEVLSDVLVVAGGGKAFWCPACDTLHLVEGWEYNGNAEKPTFRPSVLARGEFICHSFVTDGQIAFLSDCTHHLAGQTVPLGKIPDWAKNEA